jgi:dihydrofolate reductase
VLEESVRATGATVMGRRMFSGGRGPWEDDPNADAWCGDDPPFHHPVFVLTHHAREPVAKQGGTTFTFVTEGIEARARAGAGGRRRGRRRDRRRRERRPAVPARGLLDELQIHLVPVLLGDGVRLFEHHVADPPRGLECTRVIESPTGVAHLRYRVVG